jgi:macrolide-specific efflux system membrane fusion protein
MTSRLLLLALLALPGACTAPAPTQALDPAAPIRDAVDKTPHEIPEFPAVITTKTTLLLSTDFDGRVNKVNVRQGQQVHAGDVLIELDDQELRSRAAIAAHNERAAKGDAGAAYAMSGDANRQMQVQARLARAGAVAQEAVRQAAATRSQYGSQGAAASDRAASAADEKKELERLIGKAKIVAPFDGTVVSVRAKAGENARKGQTVARVSDPKDLMVKFAVPQDLRSRVKEGQMVEVLMPGQTGQVFAKITSITDVQEAPISFAVVEADIDDSKLPPNAVSPTAQGHVRIAGGKS